jgi:hypothetical protein
VRRVNFSFDIDGIDYGTGAEVDEVGLHLPEILQVLRNFGVEKTTWFLRLDADFAERFDSYPSFFQASIEVAHLLQEQGHVVGWHHHAPEQFRNSREQLEREFRKFADLAQEMGIGIVRSGFGQMTDSMLAHLINTSFEIDSSCISRPNYSWERTPLRDWFGAPNQTYSPCRNNRKKHCPEQKQLLEVPITTVVLEQETDTVPGVRRYVNLAYPRQVFRKALDSWEQASDHGYALLTITHPYETCLESFMGDKPAFIANIQELLEIGITHVGIDEL